MTELYCSKDYSPRKHLINLDVYLHFVCFWNIFYLLLNYLQENNMQASIY